MNKIKYLWLFVVCALVACGQDAPQPAGKSAQAPPAPVTTPAPTPAPEPAKSADAPLAPAPTQTATTFSLDNVPLSSATLGAFPYFSLPEGVSAEEQKGQAFNFERRFLQAGEDFVAVEGKVHQRTFRLEQGSRTFTPLEIHRNYENIIQQAGGVKTHAAQMTAAMVEKFGGRDKIEKSYFGPGAGPDYEHNTYVIKQAGKEIWLQVATGAIPPHGYVMVVERAAMAQTVTLLKADQMKKEIDAKGRVAVYINFDTDKADIKSESQPVIDEITKLLQGEVGLKLLVEGHTDNTGAAARNQTLSNERAAAVSAALVAKGIDKARLSAKGFGQDRPLADNGSEAGRAKNRRVELVKVTG